MKICSCTASIKCTTFPRVTYTFYENVKKSPPFQTAAIRPGPIYSKFQKMKLKLEK